MTVTSPNFTALAARTDDVFEPCARHAVLADLARRNCSPIGYVTVAALTFGGALIESVTVNAYGVHDMTVTVRHYDAQGIDGGATTFHMTDGAWADSLGIDLAAADDSSLTRHVDTVLGHRDRP